MNTFACNVELDLLAVSKADNALHLAGTEAGEGKGLTVPLADEYIDSTVVLRLGIADATALAESGIGTSAIDGLSILS